MKHTVLILILTALTANAFTALPALGYSASSGFILGGFFLFPFTNPDNQLTIDTYYGTAGVVKFQPSIIRYFDSGVLTSTIEYRKVLDKDWYGWGNQTNSDSTATMHFEKRNFLAEFAFPYWKNVFLTCGVDVRQSTVYDRETSYLWNRLPGEVFASTWTGGLRVTLGYAIPLTENSDVLISTDGFFQEGNVSYGGLTHKIKVTVEPWNSALISVGARLHQQYGIENTPIPYASGIGQNVNFRGYNDYRFTGPIWTLYQLELKNEVFSLKNHEGDKLITLSAAAFAEAGAVAELYEELTVNSLHTDIGGGFRLALPDNAEMRIDAAWGDDGMRIQSGFDQAF